MVRRRWLFYAVLAFLVQLPLYSGLSQYIDLSGNNPYIKQYVEEDPQNWDKSIIYVFYNNAPCQECPQAMGLIYDIYQQYYSGQYSFFEINYQLEGEGVFQNEYQLGQPLSVVLVRINDGMARGFYKLDNPQQWLNDPLYFEENLTTAINNFLVN